MRTQKSKQIWHFITHSYYFYAISDTKQTNWLCPRFCVYLCRSLSKPFAHVKIPDKYHIMPPLVLESSPCNISPTESQKDNELFYQYGNLNTFSSLSPSQLSYCFKETIEFHISISCPFFLLSLLFSSYSG